MAVLDFLRQFKASSCKWGHRWGCWAQHGSLKQVGTWKHCLTQARKCLVCDFIELKVQTVDYYDGK